MSLGFIFSFIALFFYVTGLILYLLVKFVAGVVGGMANRDKIPLDVIKEKLAYDSFDLMKKRFFVDRLIVNKEISTHFGRELQQIFGENAEEKFYEFFEKYRRIPFQKEQIENWFAKILLAKEGKGDVLIKPTFDPQNLDRSIMMIKCIEDAWHEAGVDFHLVFRKVSQYSDNIVAEIDETTSTSYGAPRRMW